MRPFSCVHRLLSLTFVREFLSAFLSTKILDAEFCVFCVFAVINSCSSCCACLTEAESERDDVVDSLLVKQFVTEQSTGATAQLTAARRTIQRSETDTADQEVPQVIASVSTAALPVACDSYQAVLVVAIMTMMMIIVIIIIVIMMKFKT